MGLEGWGGDPGALRPMPMVALMHSLVLRALVQKTESTVDRPGEPRYGDVLDRCLACTAEELG